MKALGRGSLASLLKLVLDIVWYLTWAALVFASLVLLVSAANLIMGFIGYEPSIMRALFEKLQEIGWAYPIFLAEIIALIVG